MTRLPDDFWPAPARHYRLRLVPRQGWSHRRLGIAWTALRWLGTLALYVLIVVEIYVAAVILLPPPR